MSEIPQQMILKIYRWESVFLETIIKFHHGNGGFAIVSKRVTRRYVFGDFKTHDRTCVRHCHKKIFWTKWSTNVKLNFEHPENEDEYIQDGMGNEMAVFFELWQILAKKKRNWIFHDVL